MSSLQRMWMSFNSSALLDGSCLHSESSCHLRSLFPGPPPSPTPEKKVRSPKIWRIIFYSTYGRLKGLVPVGQLCCETPCHWILPDPISLLIGSSGTPVLQASVVLFHPVPAFITVLSVLFSFNNFSVAPTEESQLWREGQKKC